MFPALAHHYGEILLLVVVVGGTAFVLGARRARLPLGRVLQLMAGLTVLAHLGGRFHLLAEHDRLLDGWRWVALDLGYRQPGALLGLAVGLATLPRFLLPGVSLALLGDLVAVATACALVVMRAGCLVMGCCFGTVCALPWALSFPAGSRASALQFAAGLLPSPAMPSLTVHPLQLYFLLLSLGVAILLWHRQARKAYHGQLLLLFLAVHESGKGFLELVRFTAPGHSTSALIVMLASFGLAAIGIAGLLIMHRRAGAVPVAVAARA